MDKNVFFHLASRIMSYSRDVQDSETADYLYKSIAGNLKNHYGLQTCKITGSGINECTIDMNKEFNNLLLNFSPKSKHREMLDPESNNDIDILCNFLGNGVARIIQIIEMLFIFFWKIGELGFNFYF